MQTSLIGATHRIYRLHWHVCARGALRARLPLPRCIHARHALHVGVLQLHHLDIRLLAGGRRGRPGPSLHPGITAWRGPGPACITSQATQPVKALQAAEHVGALRAGPDCVSLLLQNLSAPVLANTPRQQGPMAHVLNTQLSTRGEGGWHCPSECDRACRVTLTLEFAGFVRSEDETADLASAS